MSSNSDSTWSSILTIAICLACVLPASAQQEELSIEKMLAEANANARKESAAISSRVNAQITAFRFEGNGSNRAHEVARKNLVEMGFGAVPGIVAALKNSKSARLNTHIYNTLCEMYAAKTASRSAIATPLRALVNSEDSGQASTAISVLGTIGDVDSADAILLQNERKDVIVKAAVILAIAELRPDSSFALLEAAAESGDPVLRMAAARGYGLVGRNPQDQKAMVGLVSDDDDRVALLALASLSRISMNTKAMTALHDALKNTNPKFIRVAIGVIEEIGKREYSARHLIAVVKNTALPMDIRKDAAKALYNLKDKDGMMELAKSYKTQIKNQPRSVRAHEALGDFYVEFGAWELAAKIYSKALDLTRNPNQQGKLQLEIARCWARAERFKRAASYLKKTGRENFWQDLVNDPAFAKMREDKRYKKNFYE